MKNKSVKVTLAAILSLSAVAPAVMASDSPEAKEKAGDPEMSSSKFMPPVPFPWDHPGKSSPVLHPGSARGAGMVEGPLNEIDGIMEEMIDSRVMPGAVALVARRGHIVKHEAYGMAYQYKDDGLTEADQPISMAKDTIFDLASISKIFTTTAAMQLYEKGLFNLDDPVADYLPEFAAGGKEEVTIRQLMTHTSGFTAWIPLYSQGNSREDRISIALQYPLANDPGSTYTYSDLNMIALGALIEKLSGKRLDEYVRDHITKPLGMKDTMYNPPESLKDRIAATEYQPALGRGLVWGEVHDENAWSLDGVAGHAGVFSTAGDLAKFAHMYVNEGTYGGKRILKKETVRTLTENQIPQFPGDDHGLGWELNQGWLGDALTDKDSLSHTGYTGTSVVISQKNDTIAILLTNRVHPTRNTVSTNGARRAFARQVADSIPVSIPGKQPAWFSGYGDNTEKSLTAEVDLHSQAVLSFETWHRIEENSDYGYLEISADGTNWTEVKSFTGNSESWSTVKAELPADTKLIRFRYKTDATVNGRGWYLDNIKISPEKGKDIKPEFASEEWQKRSY